MRDIIAISLVILIIPICGCISPSSNDSCGCCDNDLNQRTSIRPSLEINQTHKNYIIDLNNDSNLDMLTVRKYPENGYFIFVKMSSNMHFQNQTTYPIYYPIINPSLIYHHFQPIFEDLNDDGLLDILLFYNFRYFWGAVDDPLEIFIQNRGFNKKPDFIIQNSKDIYDVEVGDFNNDDLIDILYGTSSKSYDTSIYLFYQTQNRTYENEPSKIIDIEGFGYFYDVGKINNDQYLDIIFFRDAYVSAGMVTKYSILYYDNSTNEYNQIEYKLNDREHRFQYGYLTDINSDGQLDIVTAYDSDTYPPGIESPNPNDYEEWYSDANMIFFQKNGTFSTLPDYFHETPNRICYLRFYDYNFDGLMDLFTIRDGSFDLLFQNSTGKFENAITFNYDGDFEGVSFVDYNGDETTDIIILSENRDERKMLIFLMDNDLDSNGYYDTFDKYYSELEEIRSEEID